MKLNGKIMDFFLLHLIVSGTINDVRENNESGNFRSHYINTNK